jgi:hypothetical protein
MHSERKSQVGMFVGLALILAIVVSLVVYNRNMQQAQAEWETSMRKIEAGDYTEARERLRLAAEAETERGNRDAERSGRKRQ